MANMTLSIPDDLYQKIKKHPSIRWSDVIRRSINEKVEDLEIMDSITEKSTLTKNDAEDIAKTINDRVAKRFGLK